MPTLFLRRKHACDGALRASRTWRLGVAWLAGLAVGLALAPPLEAREFDLQGHRGARGLFPENTLAAFAAALTLGVTTLEMDLAVSRDGVVVVSHNPRLAPELTRDATGAWLSATGPAIHDLTLAEIKRYNVGAIQPGSRYALRYPRQQALNEARIPTLAEVMRLVRRSGNTTVRLNLETKLRPDDPGSAPGPAAFVQAILKVTAEEGFSGRIAIQSFDWRTLREMQRVAPGVPTVYLTAQQTWLDNMQRGDPGPSPWLAGLDIDDHGGSEPAAIRASGGSVWSPYHKEVSPQSIAEAHRLGLQVIVWTVNEADRMEALIEMGVDGIITDYPDRLRDLLPQLGLPAPQPTPVTP